MAPVSDQQRIIIVGRISGLYGTQGGVRIHSHTRPREGIFSYDPWLLRHGAGWRELHQREGRNQGGKLTVRLDGIDDRDAARTLVDTDIAVYRHQLPALAEGEYYWCDLTGLKVFDQAGHCLGTVEEIRETGANDVLVIAGERRIMVPLVMGDIVTEVDLEQGRMRVDWNPEYL